MSALSFCAASGASTRAAGIDVRIEHSIGYGVYLRLLDRDADHMIVALLQTEMEKM
jgi:hypothetical protein